MLDSRSAGKVEVIAESSGSAFQANSSGSVNVVPWSSLVKRSPDRSDDYQYAMFFKRSKPRVISLPSINCREQHSSSWLNGMIWSRILNRSSSLVRRRMFDPYRFQVILRSQRHTPKSTSRIHLQDSDAEAIQNRTEARSLYHRPDVTRSVPKPFSG
jgi:hypothetical protein